MKISTTLAIFFASVLQSSANWEVVLKQAGPYKFGAYLENQQLSKSILISEEINPNEFTHLFVPPFKKLIQSKNGQYFFVSFRKKHNTKDDIESPYELHTNYKNYVIDTVKSTSFLLNSNLIQIRNNLIYINHKGHLLTKQDELVVTPYKEDLSKSCISKISHTNWYGKFLHSQEASNPSEKFNLSCYYTNKAEDIVAIWDGANQVWSLFDINTFTPILDKAYAHSDYYPCVNLKKSLIQNSKRDFLWIDKKSENQFYFSVTPYFGQEKWLKNTIITKHFQQVEFDEKNNRLLTIKLDFLNISESDSQKFLFGYTVGCILQTGISFSKELSPKLKNYTNINCLADKHQQGPKMLLIKTQTPNEYVIASVDENAKTFIETTTHPGEICTIQYKNNDQQRIFINLENLTYLFLNKPGFNKNLSLTKPDVLIQHQ